MTTKTGAEKIGIELIGEEDMRDSGKKSYDLISLSRKEKGTFKRIKFKLLEKGTLERFERGETVGPHGFLIHQFSQFRTKDGKVHGIRCEGGSGYKAPIQHDGQQTTTCADCGKDVLLNIDFKPGQIPEKNGAYCYDCIIGHPERRISIILIDADLRFKTVYHNNEGAMITNENIMRTYCGKAWIEKDKLEAGDSFILLSPLDVGIPNCIFVKTIKGEIKGSIEEFLRELIPTQDIIDTMIITCDSCGITHKLSEEELEEAANFITKHNLEGIDFLGYMELAKGRTCKNDKNHKFNFSIDYENMLHETIRFNEDAIKEHNESIVKKEKFEKERDNILAEQINKMQMRDELAKKMEEITKQTEELTIKMDGLTKNIGTESKRISDTDQKSKEMKERLYLLTKTSDIKLWKGLI